MGRARMAVDTHQDSPHQCIYCNRCLWGCGVGAIYNPNNTLNECQKYSHFSYRPHAFVTHFHIKKGRIHSINLFDTSKKKREEVPVDAVLLAAGAINSGTIFLRTLAKDPALKGQLDQKNLKTKSLLDTQVIKMPYVFLKMVGQRNSSDNFQFNKLILNYLNQEVPDYPSYVHGEILSLSSLIYHPLIESLPFGSRYSLNFFSQLKSSLGVVTFFIPDTPQKENGLALEPDQNSVSGDRINIHYQNSKTKGRLQKMVVESTTKFFWKMGCYMSRRDILPMTLGSGIHYAGTIPMSDTEDLLSVNKEGASYAYPNLHVVDGAAFPSLPSKSITFSLMANAIRVARKIS